jgi:tetratricopeptide (TPR) repeat protein
MPRKMMLSASLLALGLAFGGAAQSETAAGAYLAGRHAAVNSDFAAAARYYSEALMRDPGNVEMMESAALSYLSLGKVESALPLARAMEARKQRSQAGQLLVMADLAKQGEFKALLAREPDTSSIGPWVDGLVRAWAQVGAGDMTAALAQFDDLGKEAGMQGFVLYHKALALASVGDYEGAEAIFASDQAGGIARTRRGAIAHAEILAQLDRHEDALAMLRDSFGTSTDPELDTLFAALENGEQIPYTHTPDARAGIAEVFFTFGAILQSEAAGDYYVLLYTRIARFLRPEHIDALLLTASLLENLKQYDLAIHEYRAVPAENPAYHAAELGRAGALRRSGKTDQAIEVLEQLARTHGGLPVVHSTLGDVMRSEEKFDEAIAAYSRALDLTPAENTARWVLYYSRGIAHERSGAGEAAEADFRAALELNPEQPQVLNYLGYSLVEQQRNLDEALDMIERAVAASPDSGYIVDSLGWVLYRLGRYDEAVEQMERAVELLAVDPVLNDHLGDVYWAVGRKREAEFQWSRALSFITKDDSETEADPDRIRRKLEVGLDTVLAEEGQPPLKVSARQ